MPDTPLTSPGSPGRIPPAGRPGARTERAAALCVLLAGVAGAHAQDLLDPEVAFRAQARLVRPDTIEIRYDTAPGYYLYRDRLAYSIEPAAAALGKPNLPAGKVKHDQFVGEAVIYRFKTTVTLPVSAPAGAALKLTADLQGCADIGVCYPPVRRTFALGPAAGAAR